MSRAVVDQYQGERKRARKKKKHSRSRYRTGYFSAGPIRLYRSLSKKLLLLLLPLLKSTINRRYPRSRIFSRARAITPGFRFEEKQKRRKKVTPPAERSELPYIPTVPILSTKGPGQEDRRYIALSADIPFFCGAARRAADTPRASIHKLRSAKVHGAA